MPRSFSNLASVLCGLQACFINTICIGFLLENLGSIQILLEPSLMELLAIPLSRKRRRQVAGYPAKAGIQQEKHSV